MIFPLEITSLRLSIYLHRSTTEVSDTDVLSDSLSCVFFSVSQISLRWLFFKTHWIISLLDSAVLKSLALFLFLLIIVSSLLSWSAILSWYWLRTFSLQNSDFSLDALHNQWKKCLISRDDDSNVSHICLITLTEIASQLWSERDIKQQQNSKISQWNQRSVSLILINSDHYMSVWLRSQRSCNSVILMTWSEYDDLSFRCESKRTQCLWLVAEILARRFRQQQQQLT